MKQVIVSPDSGRKYTIDNEEGYLRCSCPDYEYRRFEEHKFCKHLVNFTTQLVERVEYPTRAQKLASVVKFLSDESVSANPVDMGNLNAGFRWAARELSREVLIPQ